MMERRTMLRAAAMAVAVSGAVYAVTLDDGALPLRAEAERVATPRLAKAGAAFDVALLVAPSHPAVRPAAPVADPAISAPIVLTPADPEPPGAMSAAFAPRPEEAWLRPAVFAPQEGDCSVSLEAAPASPGMASLSVAAPCHGREVVTIQHEAVAFTLALDADGLATASVPALRAVSAFFAFFPDGAAAMVETAVPGTEDFVRVGVLGGDGAAVLTDPGGAEVPVLGNGADAPSRAARIWQGAPGARGGLTLEFPVTEATCGRSLEATVLRQEPGATPRLAPVTVEMPECDGLGGAILLNAGAVGGMLDVR